MDWQEICDHPQLRDLPFKVDNHGKLPASALIPSFPTRIDIDFA